MTTFSKPIADSTTAAHNFRHLMLSKDEVTTMLNLLGVNDGIVGLYVVEFTTPGTLQPLWTISYVLFKKDSVGTLTPLRSDYQNVSTIDTSLLKSAATPSFTILKSVLLDFKAATTARYLPFFIQSNPGPDPVLAMSIHAPYLKFTGGGGAPGGSAGNQTGP
jgi:hypothetical protein